MQSQRLTKIIATLGPSSHTVEDIEALAKRGMTICRLNFSHGEHEDHAAVIKNIRAVQKKGYQLGIMMDTKGPEVRTGDVKVPLEVMKGEIILFTHTPKDGGKEKVIVVDYDKFAHDVRHARCIYLDNGVIEFKVVRIKGHDVYARALDDGRIGSRRHVNLPGAKVSLPPFTKRDWSDIAFGVRHGVDFVASSFVRNDSDIRTLRSFLTKRKSHVQIIAKIETPQAVADLDEIIAVSDGIMVARGDLGAEVPYEDVPSIEELIVRRCREEGKPVIVATHMLESMILSPIPTRAEVTDIAFASYLLADCTMLSGETASGKHPKKSVEVMDRILRRNERLSLSAQGDTSLHSHMHSHPDEPRREQALAASVLASHLDADAILVMSKSGLTARAVSACRPSVPMHVFTESPEVEAQLLMLWGVSPHRLKLSDNPEKTVMASITLLQKKGILKKGQRVVVVSDIRTTKKRVMTIQIRSIH